MYCRPKEDTNVILLNSEVVYGILRLLFQVVFVAEVWLHWCLYETGFLRIDVTVVSVMSYVSFIVGSLSLEFCGSCSFDETTVTGSFVEMEIGNLKFYLVQV